MDVPGHDAVKAEPESVLCSQPMPDEGRGKSVARAGAKAVASKADPSLPLPPTLMGRAVAAISADHMAAWCVKDLAHREQRTAYAALVHAIQACDHARVAGCIATGGRLLSSSIHNARAMYVAAWSFARAAALAPSDCVPSMDMSSIDPDTSTPFCLRGSSWPAFVDDAAAEAHRRLLMVFVLATDAHKRFSFAYLMPVAGWKATMDGVHRHWVEEYSYVVFRALALQQQQQQAG